MTGAEARARPHITARPRPDATSALDVTIANINNEPSINTQQCNKYPFFPPAGSNQTPHTRDTTTSPKLQHQLGGCSCSNTNNTTQHPPNFNAQLGALKQLPHTHAVFCQQHGRHTCNYPLHSYPSSSSASPTAAGASQMSFSSSPSLGIADSLQTFTSFHSRSKPSSSSTAA